MFSLTLVVPSNAVKFFEQTVATDNRSSGGEGD